MTKMLKSEKGFTLIEVLIAIALLGIIAAAFAFALGSASKAVFIADKRTKAESLARSYMENVMTQPYDTSTTAPHPTYTVNITLPSSYSGNFSVNVTALNIDPSSYNTTGNNTGLQKITVRVNFEGSQVITMSAYKEQY